MVEGLHDSCNQVVSTQYRGSMQASYNQVVASTNIPTTHPRAMQPGQTSLWGLEGPGSKAVFPSSAVFRYLPVRTLCACVSLVFISLTQLVPEAALRPLCVQVGH